MQKLLKIIGMISALVLSALCLSACNRDEGEIISLYWVPSSYEDWKELQTNSQKDDTNSGNITLDKENDTSVSD